MPALTTCSAGRPQAEATSEPITPRPVTPSGSSRPLRLGNTHVAPVDFSMCTLLETATRAHRYAPALDPTARELRLSIPTVRWRHRGPPGQPSAPDVVVDGPWTFLIVLPPPPG